MDITEIPDDAAETIQWARSLKERHVERTPVGQRDDIAPVLDFRRDPGDITVARVFCNHVNRDEALQAAHVATPIWAADHVIAAFDMHTSDERFAKRHHRLPDPTELQELRGKKEEEDLVGDGIMVAEVWRSGRGRMFSLPYRVYLVDATTKKVLWIEDNRRYYYDSEVHGGIGGIVFDGLRRPFDITTARDDPALAEVAFELDDPVRAEVHRDLAGVRVLTSFGYSVAFNAPTPLHEEVLAGTLEHVHGLEVLDMEGNVRRSTGEPTDFDVLAALTRLKLENERKRARQRDLEERARRQQARATGQSRPRSLQEIFDDLQRTTRGGTDATP
jgi:hypothetical protein